ncbi:regulator of G-protein signaling loco isoform X2 [Daktulosphaira vitifoliae]|uniref:regulator of G-protein signaling loco isoform X2 n=1 Tax=Daktulosphaira vitifoliae TaxID=58002 RepID=UPI0021AAF533|nr:regulator of G-protein signaling loco isoform X2 [Daktulosphaira vitifoliae]
MHPVRRRKKRPNYGVRIVEVNRGKNGFGFTISGQQPCILSCIVPGSPADQAGLKAGDYLVAVSNSNVSKLLHDDVVQLIGSCQSTLRLEIAENYYSDSSDEEYKNEFGKQRPKYPHKSRPALTPINVNKMKNDDINYLGENLKPIPRITYSTTLHKEEVLNYTFQVFVRYLGSIEMPCIPIGSRLQVVKSCIKRLKAEKRSHAVVLMTGFSLSLCLQNNVGANLAVYPKDRVMFCAAGAYENSKYFGVVTISAADDEPSNSCHVFAVDPASHDEHSVIAKRFKITCIRGTNGICSQFPPNCDEIVLFIEKYYKSELILNTVGNSPHLSHDSTTTSNSDSGIGYKEYRGIQTDRILMVDVQNQCLHIQQVGDIATHCIECSDSVTPKDNVIERGARSRSPLSTSSVDLAFSQISPDYPVLVSSPGPPRRSKSESSMQHDYNSCEGMSLGSSVRSQEILLPESKFKSNSTFDCPRYTLTTQSLEEFKTNFEDNKPNIWGSLKNNKETEEACEPFSNNACNESRNNQVQDWTLSFEKVLQDPVASQKFAEFLKKEFSAENLYFWTACEHYNSTHDQVLRCALARDIYSKHLSNDALESVNVDSKASNLTIQQIEQADPNLFLHAQKQVFNLMKFDSYPRFIKSDLFKTCLVEQIAESTPNIDEVMPILKSSQYPNKKPFDIDESLNNAVEYRVNTGSRRKSILSWRRQSNTQPPLTSGLCRVTLPDKSSTVLHVNPDLSVQVIIQRLFTKREFPYKFFKVTTNNGEQVINLSESSSILDGLDVKVEPRVSFRLDLPDRKTVNVDCKIDSTVGQEISSILLSYGYKTESVTLCLISENEVVDLDVNVALVDGQRIQVLTHSNIASSFSQNYSTMKYIDDSCNLDELTNQVFEDLLQNKCPESVEQPSDQGSIKKIKKTCKSQCIMPEQINNNEKKQTLSKLPPLIAKLKPNAKLQSEKLSESDALYEGLKRAQRSRLEDQRGTEINFEMPDFLKDKDNENSDTNKKQRKSLRLSDRSRPCRESARFYTSQNDEEFKRPNPINETRTKIVNQLPPPLPPKPKNLLNDQFVKKNSDNSIKKPVFLDNPTSSFV